MREGKINAETIVKVYCLCLIIIHDQMKQNIHQSSPKSKNTPTKSRIDPCSQHTTIRRYGPVTIKRVNTPPHNRDIKEITYHTPSWQRRGHIRKLKSGKEVYIKPGICRRKCMKDDTTEPAKVVVKFDSSENKV